MFSRAASFLTLATRSIASPGMVHAGQVELEKAAVLLDQLPISVEFSALAQVADEVGVHAGVVLAAGLGVGAAYSEVDRPAELLVEEDVCARPADAVVGPDPELPKVARPGVGLEQAHKVLLAFLRARLDNLPLLEPEPHSRDLASRYRRRYAEVHRSVGRVLYGSGKDLAARHVPYPCRVHERTSLDRERQVCLRTDDTDLAGLLQPLLEPLLLGRLLAPIAHGVFLVESHSLERELLVLREAHLRLLRQRLRREERKHPTVFLQHHLAQGLVALLERLLLFGVHVSERSGIARRADADLGVHELVDGARDLRDLLVVKLLRVLEELLLHPWQANLRCWSGTYLQQPRVESLYQGPRTHLRGDEDLIPLPCLGRVVHQ